MVGGELLAYGLTGFLCDSSFLGGWPAVFYLFGKKLTTAAAKVSRNTTTQIKIYTNWRLTGLIYHPSNWKPKALKCSEHIEEGRLKCQDKDNFHN